MVAAGNAVVFNVHPSAQALLDPTVALLNQAILAAGGPPDVVTVGQPTIESAQEMMHHADPAARRHRRRAVVKAAMASGKRAICAGPGNPPVVVDETAHLDKAGRDIVLGASFDNNIICTDEKEVLVVASVADKLFGAMTRPGACGSSSRASCRRSRKLDLHRGPPGRAVPAHVNKD